MVMNTNRNNYKLESPVNNEGYNHHYQPSSLNYNSWYNESSTQHNVMPHYNDQAEKPKDVGSEYSCFKCASVSCWVGSSKEGASKAESSYNNGTYGSRSDDDDDDGFAPKSGSYRYHQSVVNFTGSATNTNILRNPSDQVNKSPFSCCVSPLCGTCCADGADNTTTPEDERCCNSWCKPTILLLLLVLLVVVFVLISGILLCFNYIVYKPRAPILEEPCEKTYCQFGADCVAKIDGTAHCECPKTCSTVFTPVCASDGNTYSNHCAMRKASCQRGETLRVQYSGECELPDPCRDVKCQHGARCVPSVDGRSAKCECPSKCPLYGDHADSRPLCGTDGVDYRDTCELRRAACASSTNISIKFHGKCDPCSSVSCPEPEVCQLDEKRNPVCRCGDTCSLDFTPVCGSDGKTYSNECVLRQESCRSRKNLRIIYRGKCSSGMNPCASMKCERGEECVITKFGMAQCDCPPSCEPVMSPVCGTDGRTYDSLCEMYRISCAEKKVVRLAHTGRCGGSGPCAKHTCEHGGLCVEREGEPVCQCPVCSSEFDPVCGSDGISYGNECKLRLQACQHSRTISVLYSGLCNGCENKKCDHYAVCESNGTENAKCVCPDSCPEVHAPVCGTDGITYDNECQLRISACKTKQFIVVSYKGDCDLCEGVKCKYGARCEAGECVCPTNCSVYVSDLSEPVCASNMVTYANECELQRASCLQPDGAVPLNVVFYGDCREKFAVGLTTATLPSLQKVQQQITSATSRPHIMKGSGIVLPDVSNFITPSAEEEEACRDIRCYFDATCELGPDKFPRCSCKFNCTLATMSGDNKPVCASDMRLYSSMCSMKMEGCQRQEELRLRPLELCEGMEVKPCNGEQPLLNPDTQKDYDCGSGPHRKDCPPGSYCHQTPHFAKCCRKDLKTKLKSCEDSWYGCCPDGKTPALAPEDAGCPSMCGCNKLGSYSDTCDPISQQCSCKPGVGGLKCDRCEPGFWGLPKISEGHEGCIPCGCSLFGSVRDDCEQMTGRCMCKPGIQGQKCTVCTGYNMVLGPNGCVTADSVTHPPTSCSELTCYFGANCEEHNGYAKCVCHSTCMDEFDDMKAVCGNDGKTYGSECQLKLFSCRYQKDIVVQHLGACKDFLAGTEGPLGRSTAHRYMEPDDVSSPLYKSTRHLLVPEWGHHYYFSSRQDESNSLTSASLHGIGISRNFGNDIYYAAGYRPTPATIRVVTALLGDLCVVNDDCNIRYSHCVDGACTCKDGFAETPDRQECIANTPPIQPTIDIHACASLPCQMGATCQDTPHGSFKCICGPLWTGRLCSQPLIPKAYDIPAFDGQSYVQLKRLKAYNKLSLEVEFMTYGNDGIILYNQQKSDGTGDFVSLAIVNGYVDFRYNLGNGPVVITSLERIQLKKFHKIVVKRYHRDGVLKLDEFEDVAGQSQGMLKALDLVEDAYIGYVPTNVSKIFENIGTSMGLMGCIRKMKIGRHTVELHEGHDLMVERAIGVRECGENPCSSLPCQNGGTCKALDSKKYECVCTLEFIGDHCEKRLNPCLSNPCTSGATCESLPHGGYICKCPPRRKGKSCEDFDAELYEIFVPEFHGDSYLELPRLDGVGRAFSLEVWFLSREPDGILLYNGQLLNGKGDFISINLVNGHVQFKFDLGSGAANLTSSEAITLGHWHAVKVTRLNKDATIKLDDGEVIYGSSAPPLNELNLELPLYIGGVPLISEVNQEAELETGLVGAIQRLIVNGHSWENLAEHNDIRTQKGVTRYEGEPCPINANPCVNGGVCQPILSTYGCKCPLTYTGTHCEEYVDLDESDKPVRFSGETFYSYPNKVHRSTNTTLLFPTNETNIDDNDESEYEEEEEEEESEENEMFDEYDGDGDDDMYDYDDDSEFFYKRRKGERVSRYEMSFRTTENNGLLLWMSKGRTLKSDYIVISIVNGFVEFSFNLGKRRSFLLLKSKIHVADGAWHTLVANRRKRQGMLQIDTETPVRGIAERGSTLLHTNGQLWIGGAPTLPSGLPASYYLGFKGCIHRVKVSRKPLNLLNRLGDNKSTVHFCHDNDV